MNNPTLAPACATTPPVTFVTPAPVQQLLLTTEQVLMQLQISRSTLMRRIAAGAFPKPITDLGRNRWRTYDIREHVDQAT